MNITRHNYEEFFILYMDNELSSDDRRMVEAFIQNHPDLKEELEILMQYKLVPDESIVFSEKEELIRGNSYINLANIEESLLLYIDNELPEEKKQLVEKFVAANPVAAKELELLQKSKLQPESIVFANKESLYRKEENVHRLPIRWWRAAAAVLIVAIGLTTFLLLYNKKVAIEGPIVKTPGIEQTDPVIFPDDQSPKENIVADINEKQNTENVNPEEKDDIHQAVTPVRKQENKNLATNNAIQSPVIKQPENNYAVQPKKEDAALIANNKGSNNLPQPTSNPNVLKNDAVNNAIANSNVPKEKNKVEALTNSVVTSKSPQPSDYTNASFIEEESQQDGKKNKLRGFFRKLTRTFEKRTNIDATDDDGKLLIAGLAIKLK